MVPSRCSDTANFLFVNPLLDRREADTKLKSRVAQLQQFFVHRYASFRLRLPGHFGIESYS